MRLLALVLTLSGAAAACAPDRPEPTAQPGSSSSSAAPTSSVNDTEFRLTATLQELMDAELDPAADFLWDSVASISRVDGMEERQPRTDEEWHEVRRHALRLLEATNLLVMSGRRVSRAYLPGSADGELDSNAMQAKIDANRPAFNAFAHGVHDAGSQLLKAIDARDATTLFDVGSVLDQACESCHMVFWFPNPSASPRR